MTRKMGYSIIMYAEKKVDGRWQPIDEWIDNPDYKEGNKEPKKIEKFDKCFYETARNPYLFRILAGIFKAAYINVEPISYPKGLPLDCCDEIAGMYKATGHINTSYFTLSELLEVDWDEYDKRYTKDFIKKVIGRLVKVGAKEEDVRIIFWFNR